MPEIQGDIMIFIITSMKKSSKTASLKYKVTLWYFYPKMQFNDDIYNHVNQKMKFEDFISKIQGDIMIFIIMSIKNLSSMTISLKYKVTLWYSLSRPWKWSSRTIYIPEIQGDIMIFIIMSMKMKFKDYLYPWNTRWHYDIHNHVHENEVQGLSISLKYKVTLWYFYPKMQFNDDIYNHVNQKMKFEDFNSKIQGDIMIFLSRNEVQRLWTKNAL